MKKLIQLTPLLILLLSACNDSTKEEEIKPANGMDAASKFLRAALDGDYKKARTYLVNDSTTIIHYSNSYKNKPDSLKIIRINGQWFVDLNFTFQPKDSIPK